MKIVSSKRISFLVSNIFERYYEAIVKELYCSGLTEELAQKVMQEILMSIYRKALDEGIENEEELDILAEPIINERLEKVLFLHYAKKYVDRFPIDKASLEKGMVDKTQESRQDESDDSFKKQTIEQPVKETVVQPVKETVVQPVKETVVQPVKEMVVQPVKETVVQPEEQVIEESLEEFIVFEKVERKIEKEEQKISENEIVESEPDKKLRPYDDYEDAEEMEIIDLVSERKDVPVIRRMEEPRIRRFQINWGLTILVSVVVTMVLWFVVGILMGRGYIPRVDMGYTWFNSHIWSVF